MRVLAGPTVGSAFDSLSLSLSLFALPSSPIYRDVDGAQITFRERCVLELGDFGAVSIRCD